jgi:hypothetical protein
VTKTVSFANGGEIPVIGFGTWQIKGQTCVDAVRTALRSDYRHVDTAGWRAPLDHLDERVDGRPPDLSPYSGPLNMASCSVVSPR